MSALFLSCDWGTSNFRLRLINTVSLASVSESFSGDGVAHVYNEWQQDKAATARIHFYQAVLRRHINKIEAAVGHSLEGALT